MSNKVEERRNRKIAEAVHNNNWEEVSRLLDQPMENLERKDRDYKLSSLNAETSSEGRTTEVMDSYPDNTYNPVEQLLIKERNEYLNRVLDKLSADDLHIFLEITLNGTSALQLTKETMYKSHKTVQRHYESSCELLKEELKKYF